MGQKNHFDIGQIVHHLKYGYRGVIFDFDDSCLAEDEWYTRNNTQPQKNQPWYRVLVDNASHTTYVAESNLEPDSSKEPIQNPLVFRVFATYHDDRYHRFPLN